MPTYNRRSKAALAMARAVRRALMANATITKFSENDTFADVEVTDADGVRYRIQVMEEMTDAKVY